MPPPSPEESGMGPPSVIATESDREDKTVTGPRLSPSLDTSTPNLDTNSTPTRHLDTPCQLDQLDTPLSRLDTPRHHLGWYHARPCQGAKLDTSTPLDTARHRSTPLDTSDDPNTAEM